MAKTIWNAEDRRAVLGRLEGLREDARAQWGKMTVSQMVRHCELGVLAAMGEYKVAPVATPFKFWPMSKLIIHWLPWPKGAPTADELLVKEDGDLRARVVALRATVERFVSRGREQKLEDHAAFGRISADDWGALVWRHLDHHLRQFGA